MGVLIRPATRPHSCTPGGSQNRHRTGISRPPVGLAQPVSSRTCLSLWLRGSPRFRSRSTGFIPMRTKPPFPLDPVRRIMESVIQQHSNLHSFQPYYPPMADENTARFLPFHALNEFMRNDYRLAWCELRSWLCRSCPRTCAAGRILTKKLVKVRASVTATKPCSGAGQSHHGRLRKNPALVAAILAPGPKPIPPCARKFTICSKRAAGRSSPKWTGELPGFGSSGPKARTS
jgi:hypothetical protein